MLLHEDGTSKQCEASHIAPSLFCFSLSLCPVLYCAVLLCCCVLCAACDRGVAEPDVYNYRLQAGDEFIIVSTDGLFQDMSSQEAVDYAAAYLAQQRDREQQHSSASPSVSSRSSWLPQWARSSSSSGSSGSSSSSSSSASIVSRLSSVVWPSCSSFLASRALLHASEKHIGRRQTDADNLSWVAQLPIGERRAVHDDCTVMIIHLAHGTGGSDITATAQITGDDAAESQFHIQSKL